MLDDTTKAHVREVLADTDWDCSNNNNNCSDNFHLFYSKYLDTIEDTLAVHVDPATHHPIQPWFTDTHHRAINERNQLHACYKRNPTQERWDQYVSSQNSVKSLLCKAKQTYVKTQLNLQLLPKFNGKESISLFSQDQQKKKHIDSIQSGTETINYHLKIASEFNKYYDNVAHDTVKDLVLPYCSIQYIREMQRPSTSSVFLYFTN